MKHHTTSDGAFVNPGLMAFVRKRNILALPWPSGCNLGKKAETLLQNQPTAYNSAAHAASCYKVKSENFKSSEEIRNSQLELVT